MRTRLRRVGGSLMFLAATFIAAPFATSQGEPLAERVRQSRSLIPVIGHWTRGADSAMTVDGSKWSGTTTSAELDRASRQLFGAVNADFARNGAAPGAFPLAVSPDIANFTSGTLRVQFNMIGGASDQNAGIVFNLGPTGEYLYARYNTKDGDLALWKFVNGERVLIVHGTGSAKLALNQWHELVVQVRDRKVSASIAGNSALALEHTLDAAPSGKVGVWVKRDAVTAFKGLVVQRVQR